MFVRAALQTAEYEELFIPREALLRGTSEGSQDIVYTINENNQAVRQIVQVGMFLDELVSIERGIESGDRDRKSTRLNSSHVAISYAVFCLKKKKEYNQILNRNVPCLM